ncbi:ABC transporter substrate-binding protein [Sciscionella sediminilitoris]|uniref:ABC transporter substrate-binding protein n=1 Tax=Sciscionella sediminilitoris TaxID=1445613 RepID=UPI0012E25A7B|nr:ABC transporter substrate-binding protein [Sciscionella sp. SE31]
MPRAMYPTLLVLCLLTLSACTGTAPQPQPRPPMRTATIDVASEPATLNPVAGYAPDGAAQFYDGLLEHRADGRAEPALATALPEPDASGTRLTVPIRKGVRFSDGSPLRPADVVATYRAVLDPVYRSPLRARYANLRAVEEAGDGSVRFTLAHRDPGFERLLTLGIVPAAALREREPAGRLPISTRPVGTGPFAAVDWRRGQSLTMRARTDYWDGKPKLDRITVRFQPDERARLADLREHKADAARVANSNRQSPVDGTSAVESLSAEYRAVTLPEDNPVTGDQSVRDAMNRALDRSALVRDALGGVGEPASTPFTSAQPEYQDPSARYQYAKGKAEQELQQAGWTAKPGAVRAKHGTQARFTLRYPDGDPEAKALAEGFAKDMRTVGIQVDPASGEPADGEAALVARGDPFAPGIPDATAQAQTDPAQRAIAYRAADRAYFAKPDLVVLARMAHTYLVADRLRGYQPVLDPVRPQFTWGLYWNLPEWTT